MPAETAAAAAPLAGRPGMVRALSAWGLGAAIANMIVGSGIFVLPAAMAATVGSAAPLYYVACAVMVGAVAVCFAEAGSRVAVPGGVAGCVEAAIGRYAGFLTSLMLWLSAVLAAAGIDAAVVEGVGRWAPALREPVWRAASILALSGALAGVNLLGVRAGGRLAGVMILAKLAPLALLVVVGGLFAARAPAAAPPPAHAEVGRAMLLGVFAFMGMETGLGVAGEVRRPERSVPLAILGSMAAVTALYVAIQLVAERLLGPDLGRSAAPLVDAARRGSPALGMAVGAGALLSMLGYLASDMLAAPRILFGMAREGLLPAGLAAVRPRTRAPAAAILAHAGLVAALAITGTFSELVILSTLVTLVAYVLGCLAAVVLQRRKVATQGPPLDFRYTPLAAAVGVISMLWVASRGTWQELAAVLATLALATAYYLACTVRLGRRPRI